MRIRKEKCHKIKRRETSKISGKVSKGINASESELESGLNLDYDKSVGFDD